MKCKLLITEKINAQIDDAREKIEFELSRYISQHWVGSGFYIMQSEFSFLVRTIYGFVRYETEKCAEKN
jgi:hypothetical protein